MRWPRALPIALVALIALLVFIDQLKRSSLSPGGTTLAAFRSEVPGLRLADSPWPKEHHDLQNTSRSHLRGPTRGQVLWKTLIVKRHGVHVTSSPAVDQEGNIYVGSQDHQLYSLRPDGTFRWTHDLGAEALGVGPVVVSGGRVLMSAGEGKLLGLTTAGSLLWTRDLVPDGERASVFPSISPTMLPVGNALTGASNRWKGSHGETLLHSVSQDGEVVWTSAVLTGFSTSCPALSVGRDLYVTTSTDTYALDLLGRVRWRVPVGSPDSPALTDSGDVIVSRHEGDTPEGFPQEGLLVSIASSGQIRWKTPMTPTGGAAVAADGTLYVGCTDGVRAIRPDGRVAWHACRGLMAVGGSPSIDSDGNVYVGFCPGAVYSLTPSGKVRWHLKIGDAQGTGTTPVIGAPGRIYIGGRDRHLYAIE